MWRRGARGRVLLASATSSLIRGTCACGQKYRIRNARPGAAVRCPRCKRPIPITDADVRAARGATRLIPVQPGSEQLLEVIPIDDGTLRLAPEDARPGLTGDFILEHDEAAVAYAHRTTYDLMPFKRGARKARRWFSGWAAGADEPAEPVERTFPGDLVASFYCAGSRRNALNILMTALAWSVFFFVQYLLVALGMKKLAAAVTIVALPLYAVLLLFVFQFYWAVLQHTAAGEDEIPWVQTEASFWRGTIKPLVWIVVISGLCSAPEVIYRLMGVPLPPAADALILAAGWFFWPAMVMSVALGESIFFVRPDWVLRCILGIGPAYLLAWTAVLVALAGWFVFMLAWQYWVWIPIVGFAVNLYFGYVLFRTLGLLFRHFRDRLPWRF